MAYIDDLTSARDNYALRLKEASESPKMNYNLDGQMFDWTGYQDYLSTQIKRLNELISSGSPPYQESSIGYT